MVVCEKMLQVFISSIIIIIIPSISTSWEHARLTNIQLIERYQSWLAIVGNRWEGFYLKSEVKHLHDFGEWPGWESFAGIFLQTL